MILKKKSISKFNTENNIPALEKNKEPLLLDLNTPSESVRDKILRLTNRRSTKYISRTNDEFFLNKVDYMDKLAKINDDFTKTKNEFRKHFKVNDYGCNFSKLEYEFLTKKYFNK